MNKKLLATALTSLILGAADRFSTNLIIANAPEGDTDLVSASEPIPWNSGVPSMGVAYFSDSGPAFASTLFDAKIRNGAPASRAVTLPSGLGENIKGNGIPATVPLPRSKFGLQYDGEDGNPIAFSPPSYITGYDSAALTTAAPDILPPESLKQGKPPLLKADETPLDSALELQDKRPGNATNVFNGAGSPVGIGELVLVPEVNSVWAIAIIALLSFVGSFLRRFQKKLVPVPIAVSRFSKLEN